MLAPFTGGLSLLPTAFVVLFGNASALAMYGGSEFFLGQNAINKEEVPKDKLKEKETPETALKRTPERPIFPRYLERRTHFDEVDGLKRNGPDSFNVTNNYYSPTFNINVGDYFLITKQIIETKVKLKINHLRNLQLNQTFLRKLQRCSMKLFRTWGNYRL